MKVQHRLITLLFLINTACVSVGLPTGPKHEPADNITFEAPNGPFKEVDDHTWRNSTNGNSISFFSNCLDSDDRDLVALQRESLSVFDNIIEKKENRFPYNQREALGALVKGTLDGVKVKMKLVSFKKNNCSFSIHYVARVENFDVDKVAFQKFLDRFSAK